MIVYQHSETRKALQKETGKRDKRKTRRKEGKKMPGNNLRNNKAAKSEKQGKN
jgi:hypothetical protein